MEHRKDSRGRADAERERNDGDGRDERRFEKRAESELETTHQGVGRANVLRSLLPGTARPETWSQTRIEVRHTNRAQPVADFQELSPREAKVCGDKIPTLGRRRTFDRS